MNKVSAQKAVALWRDLDLAEQAWVADQLEGRPSVQDMNIRIERVMKRV